MLVERLTETTCVRTTETMKTEAQDAAERAGIRDVSIWYRRMIQQGINRSQARAKIANAKPSG